ITARYLRRRERMIGRIYSKSQIIAVSESTRDALARVGTTRAQVTIIHNGLDHQTYYPGADDTVEHGLIVVASRMKRYKCLDHLLLAAHLLRKRNEAVRLVLIGDGDDRSRLESLSRSQGLERLVMFTGSLTDQAKAEWLRRSYLTVQPSAVEGWGLSLIEAN